MAIQFLHAPQLNTNYKTSTALGDFSKTLMQDAQQGFAFNEKKRQNTADNLYRDRTLMQNDNQFNKTFGLNQDKFVEDKRQFDKGLNYKYTNMYLDDANTKDKLKLGWHTANKPTYTTVETEDGIYSFNKNGSGKLGGYLGKNTPKQVNPFQSAFYEERTNKLKSDAIKSKTDQLQLNPAFDKLSEKDQLRAIQYVQTYGVMPNISLDDKGWRNKYSIDLSVPNGSQTLPKGSQSLSLTNDNAQMLEQLKQIQQDMAKYK